MADIADPRVTDAIPLPQATVVILLGVAIGLAVSFLSGLLGGPWYLKAAVGFLLGSVLGGLLLGVAAGLRARLLARRAE